MGMRQLAAQWHEAEQMRITIAAVLVLLTGAAAAEPLKLVYDERRQVPSNATGRSGCEVEPRPAGTFRETAGRDLPYTPHGAARMTGARIAWTLPRTL